MSFQGREQSMRVFSTLAWSRKQRTELLGSQGVGVYLETKDVDKAPFRSDCLPFICYTKQDVVRAIRIPLL